MYNQTEIQAQGPVAMGQRKPISADSFRKLTALLKKPQTAIIPDLGPILPMPVVVAPTPVPVDVPKDVIVSVPEIMAEPIVAIVPVAIAPEPAAPEIMPVAEVEIVPVVITPEHITPEIIAEPEIQISAAEIKPEAPALEITPIAIAPVLEIVPILAALAVDATPALDVEQPTENIVAAEMIEPTITPVSHRTGARKKPQDVFSMLPSAPTPTASDVQIASTPEQEAEAGELARSLLDMMAASASGGQPQERALAADTLLRMVPRLPVRTKITLAERLCMMETPPPFLVAKLINDPELNVAGPLLEECMHIPDEDLLNLIDNSDVSRLRMIARRRRLSRPIAERLATIDDSSVLITLVRNQGAEIPQEGFDAIAAVVPEYQELLAPLCTRADLPVHFAFDLFWLAPAQLRRYLLSRFLTDSEMLTKILKITMDSNGEEQNSSASADIETIKAALAQAAINREEAAQFFAAAAKINHATAERILKDPQGEPLMALLKVAGVARSQLEEILPTLNQGEQPLIDPAREVEELQAVFDHLSFNKARILLTYWDWSMLKTGPYSAQN